MSPGTEVEVVVSLDELKARVMREHNATLVAARTTIAHAIRAGEALIEIRAILLPKEEWTDWVEKEFPLTNSQGYLYMRLAKYKEMIPPKIESLTQADKLLVGLPSIDGGPARPRVDDLRKEEARRWREEDTPVPWKQIAKRLDLSVSTVYRWFKDTGDAARRKAASEALREKSEAETAARLARANKTALSEAYSLTERLRDVLGQARREAKTNVGRLSIRRAEEYNHGVHDFVVQALGEEK